MDEAIAIPGTKRRMGLDPLLGLIPGVGDAVAALMSTWIVIGALRWRVPLWRVTRMVLNILIDLALGSVPVVGDIFDFFFEENVMNLKMLLRYRDRRQPPRTIAQVAGVTIMVVLFILAVDVLIVVGLFVVAFWLFHRYWH